MAPPVAVNVTVTAVVEPSLSSPATANCWVAPGASVMVAGVITTRCSTGAPAATATTAVSAVPVVRPAAMTR